MTVTKEVTVYTGNVDGKEGDCTIHGCSMIFVCLSLVHRSEDPELQKLRNFNIKLNLHFAFVLQNVIV